VDCKFVLSVLVLECNTSIAQYSMFLEHYCNGIGKYWYWDSTHDQLFVLLAVTCSVV